MPSGPFFTHRVGSRKTKDLATAVMVDHVDVAGRKLTKQPVIITLFLGSNLGKPSATDLVNTLNEAWTKFHTGELLPVPKLDVTPKEIHLACKAQVDTDNWEPIVAFESFEDATVWNTVLNTNADDVNERLNEMTYEFSIIKVKVLPSGNLMDLEQAYKTLTDEREAWFKSLHPAKELPDGNPQS